MVEKSELLPVLEQIERDKGIKKDDILKMIEQALVSAYKKHSGKMVNLEARINPDTAMLTGLVHGVGKLYILTRSTHHPALFADQEMYQHIVNDWHGSIAKVLLENWQMAEDVITAVSSYSDDSRQGRGPSALLADVLESSLTIAACRPFAYAPSIAYPNTLRGSPDTSCGHASRRARRRGHQL